MKALNSWALPSDRVEGTSFSLYHYRYEKKNGYWRYGQSIACGSVSVSVSSSRIDEASLLLKLGKKNGATDVSSVHYMLSDDLKRRQSEIALVNAVNAAKTDAEVAAKSFGFSLTSILLVDVRNYAENVSYDEDDAYCDDSCFHKLENNFESFHSKPQGFLKAGYIETEASVDAVYALQLRVYGIKFRNGMDGGRIEVGGFGWEVGVFGEEHNGSIFSLRPSYTAANAPRQSPRWCSFALSSLYSRCLYLVRQVRILV